MTFNSYLPPGIYAFIVNLARQNELGIKEIQIMLIREQIGLLGFTCDHVKIGYPKNKSKNKGGKPFCKECWTRMEMITPARYESQNLIKEGNFRPTETFLDRRRKEESRTHLADRSEKLKLKPN